MSLWWISWILNIILEPLSYCSLRNSIKQLKKRQRSIDNRSRMWIKLINILLRIDNLRNILWTIVSQVLTWKDIGNFPAMVCVGETNITIVPKTVICYSRQNPSARGSFNPRQNDICDIQENIVQTWRKSPMGVHNHSIVIFSAHSIIPSNTQSGAFVQFPILIRNPSVYPYWFKF